MLVETVESEKSMEPERKKLKLETRMECVLDDSLIQDVPTVEVYIGKILNKKDISKIIMKLNAIHPIPSLQHLKRIRQGSDVIISFSNVKDVKSFLETKEFDISLLGPEYTKISVPLQPKTRKQFQKVNKLWPCNFHEDKDLEKLINNEYTNEEIQNHEKWMKIALNNRGVVIVDPKDDSLKASSGSCIDQHPLKHATMMAIDLIARSQGGGAWGSSTGQVNIKDEQAPYLCTNYYAYLFKEPCTMCAMALVHSRIKKVFYSLPYIHGAFGSATKLHCIKPLNHHFEVYRGLLHDQGLKLLQNSS